MTVQAENTQQIKQMITRINTKNGTSTFDFNTEAIMILGKTLTVLYTNLWFTGTEANNSRVLVYIQQIHWYITLKIEH